MDQNISIVVIGYNEGKNLERTFNAILNMDFDNSKLELIYVDSGSSDNSIEIAKTFTDKIFVEKENPGPARNRNRGMVEASNDIIHFIDGDVIIGEKYLKRAVDVINAGTANGVVGYLKELSNKGWNKILLSYKPKLKEGPVRFTSAGGTYSRKAILNVNGYDERIKRGEEPELGERFYDAGYKIWYIDEMMGIHNYGVTSFWGVVRRFYIRGEVSTYNFLLPGQTRFFKKAKKNYYKDTLIDILYSIILILSIFYSSWLLLFIVLHLIYLLLKPLSSKQKHSYNFYLHIIIMFICRPVTCWGRVRSSLRYLFLSKKQKLEYLPTKIKYR